MNDMTAMTHETHGLCFCEAHFHCRGGIHCAGGCESSDPIPTTMFVREMIATAYVGNYVAHSNESPNQRSIAKAWTEGKRHFDGWYDHEVHTIANWLELAGRDLAQGLNGGAASESERRDVVLWFDYAAMMIRSRTETGPIT